MEKSVWASEETERERETDRQTDRQRQRDRERKEKSFRSKKGKTEINDIERWVKRDWRRKKGEIVIKRGKKYGERERETDRQTDRQRQIDR